MPLLTNPMRRVLTGHMDCCARTIVAEFGCPTSTSEYLDLGVLRIRELEAQVARLETRLVEAVP